MTADGWTVADACEQFAAAGMPVDPAAFRLVIKAVRLTGKLKPVGEKRAPAGSKGGRGWPVYAISDMQRLHARMADLLTPQQMED